LMIPLPLAFVLANVETGTEKEVLDSIKKISEVKAVHMVYGLYDIVAILESENLKKLRQIVTKEIRRLDNVRSTVTMIVIE